MAIQLTPHVYGLRGGVADLRETLDTAVASQIARIVVSLPGEPGIPRNMRYTRKKRLRMAPMAFGTGKGRQGDAPNCSFHAAIAMLTDADPRAVSRSVRRDAHAGTVSVRTAAGDHHLEDTLPVWRPTNQLLYGTTDDGSPLVPYLEKAWAKYRGGYQNMKAGPHRVFTWFTGRPSHVDGVRNFSSADLRHLATDRSNHPKPMPEVVFRQLFVVLSWCELRDPRRG
ncbi:MAG TPA: C2 family cysteine protease [Jiangellaceae bacterium]